MTALWIILGILLILWLLLMLRLSLTVSYRDTLCIRATLAGLPLWQYPKKKKAPRPSYRLPKRQKQKKRVKATPSVARTPQEKTLVKSLGTIRRFLAYALKKFGKHLRLRATRIIIRVGSDDAAKTAMLFGAVNQGVAAILEILDQAGKWRGLKRAQVSVQPDFCATATTADIEISLSLSVGQLASIALGTLWLAFKARLGNKKKQKQDK